MKSRVDVVKDYSSSRRFAGDAPGSSVVKQQMGRAGADECDAEMRVCVMMQCVRARATTTMI
jgi:hypothetical protein